MTAVGRKVLDTNLVVRLVVRDDPAQVALVESLLHGPLHIPLTVLQEAVWVLTSRYKLARDVIADALGGIIDLPTIDVDAPDQILWVLDRFRAGADVADMLHLVAGRDGEAFLTFDREVARATLSGSPLPIVTLKP